MLFGNGDQKRFFTLLQSAAKNICESTRVFGEMTDNLTQSDGYAATIKELEHTGDKYTRELISLLNSMFITPLEREDILSLAQALDDVIDGVEAVASRLAIYRIAQSDDHIREFARILNQQAAEIAVAVERLGTKQQNQIQHNSVKINQLENEGDSELRKGLAQLFASCHDPIHLMKMKEIYEALETTTDRAEDVADALESVVMKNA